MFSDGFFHKTCMSTKISFEDYGKKERQGLERGGLACMENAVIKCIC